MNEKLVAFERLLTIMDELREKCPWDKKQTMQSLRHLTIEETYELADAIIENDMEGVKKELGDLLLHIVFYARIGAEAKHFDILAVINSLCDKLISRHPHIYSDVKADTEEEVKQNWERIKLKEKDSITAGGFKSVLAGVPNSLPSLVKASRIQDKAKAVGFDWENKEQVWEKVEEELKEFKAEVNSNGAIGNVEAEFGDVLFSLINYARFVGVNPEDALEKTNKKFIKRFQFIEKHAAADGKKIGEMSLAEMDVYWNRAKTDA